MYNTSTEEKFCNYNGQNGTWLVFSEVTSLKRLKLEENICICRQERFQ
jgi:hypothetical protein